MLPTTTRDAHAATSDKRRVIIAAATSTFLRDGYARTSMDGIAKLAGVSKRTIYNHFGSKEGLFAAVAETTLGAIVAEAKGLHDARLGESHDLRSDLIEFGREYVRLFLRPDLSALRRLAMAEAWHHPEVAEIVLSRDTEAGATGDLSRALRNLAGRGQLEIPDPTTAAAQLTVLLTMDPWIASRFGTSILTDTEIDSVVIPNIDFFLRAYGRRRADRSRDAPQANDTELG